ncbi:MAG: tol-pal system-associated acyl-CoA thioesterase [Rhodospirillaceae bacterium]|nr:tol-pal system-associated acyl-CoA thioesterase [Rhodospirillaceae bacterium]|tara:strand:+ start:1981 stop:2421 length:441 start_codon:yes stop_codon:yes gene_type:complete
MKIRAPDEVATSVHIFPVRVYYEDTDASGIVYHASYLRFAERARTELLRDLNLNQKQLAIEENLHFVVRSCEIHYLSAAKLDDELVVESHISMVRGASLKAKQVIRRAAKDLVRLDVLVACVNSLGGPVRLPQRLRVSLASYLCDM